MTQYRIRIYNTLGLELMNRPFVDKAEWDKYWTELQTEKSLMGFTGQGMVILSKEYLTQGCNWESEDKFPVTVTERV